MAIKLGLAAAALVMVSGAVYAAGWGCDGKGPGVMGHSMGAGLASGMRGEPDPQRMVARLDRALALNPEQRDQVAALLKAKFDQHRAQHPAMQTMRGQFAELDPSSPDYLQKSASLAKQQAAVMEAHMAERAQVMADIYALLTPEQQERFKILQKERAERQDHGGWMKRG